MRKELERRLREYLAVAQAHTPDQYPLDVRSVSAAIRVSPTTLYKYAFNQEINAAEQRQRESGHLAAEGRWFTRDREALIWYREDKGPEARPVVVFVDVPERMLERLRVSNQPEPARFSRDPENEFFLPASLARMKRRLGAAELIGAPVPRAMHDRGESSVRTARPVMER